ncbi:MAG: ABC transporter ATP-binding protein [Oscillospiraceae bacterium]|nr:ABC transporter ATP-binding protein [Oscillospiraceae bacterium]
MKTTLLQAKEIGMSYSNKQALKKINMTVESGKIIGLLGPNGSGKTTLMKLIAGLLQPVSGEIVYHNNVRRGVESRSTISFMPDELRFPSYMSVEDAFNYYRDMYPDYSSELADQMKKLLGIDEEMKSKMKHLSKGQKERVALALTFSRRTKVYLLDEPLGGIDPVGKKKIVDAILAMQLEESSILISTHLVKDVERIFDCVYFISDGAIVYEGDCDQMREENEKTVEQAYLEVFSYGD